MLKMLKIVKFISSSSTGCHILPVYEKTNNGHMGTMDDVWSKNGVTRSRTGGNCW